MEEDDEEEGEGVDALINAAIPLADAFAAATRAASSFKATSLLLDMLVDAEREREGGTMKMMDARWMMDYRRGWCDG